MIESTAKLYEDLPNHHTTRPFHPRRDFEACQSRRVVRSWRSTKRSRVETVPSPSTRPRNWSPAPGQDELFGSSSFLSPVRPDGLISYPASRRIPPGPNDKAAGAPAYANSMARSGCIETRVQRCSVGMALSTSVHCPSCWLRTMRRSLSTGLHANGAIADQTRTIRLSVSLYAHTPGSDWYSPLKAIQSPSSDQARPLAWFTSLRITRILVNLEFRALIVPARGRPPNGPRQKASSKPDGLQAGRVAASFAPPAMTFRGMPVAS